MLGGMRGAEVFAGEQLAVLARCRLHLPPRLRVQRAWIAYVDRKCTFPDVGSSGSNSRFKHVNGCRLYRAENVRNAGPAGMAERMTGKRDLVIDGDLDGELTQVVAGNLTMRATLNDDRKEGVVGHSCARSDGWDALHYFLSSKLAACRAA